MLDDATLRPDPDEPLALRVATLPAGDGEGPRLELELSSRGDRVPARVALPPTGDAPPPVVLLVHGLGGSRDAAYMQMARRWVSEGAAVATLDLPLHGARANAKMGERLAASAPRALRGEPLDGVEQILWTELARQAVLDLRRLLDALAQLPQVDATRVAYVGFSLGGLLGCALCGADPRPRAAAIAVAGTPPDGAALALSAWVERIAPRPLLFVNAERDETIPREAALRLHAAARGPADVAWFASGHADLPGAALKRIWQFVRAHVGLDGAEAR
ncbi:MAG: alpha/beta fold hydrolase [Myxococcota bacterium]